jgi:lysophospholipase L1-like esterase
MKRGAARSTLAAGVIACSAQMSGFSAETLPAAESLLPAAIVSAGNQGRLHDVFRKAGGGGKIVIGVIGGSITQGAACQDPKRRYHGVMLDWWRRTFPEATFELVNAGIGATGSDYGAMRVERDLLSRNPDLVVLEYAVNDKNTRERAESYEGVVRKILNAPGKPALVLLFMMNSQGGNAQEWQAKIGNHYALPMVSYRDALWPEIQAGRLAWEQLSPDTVHPNADGHAFAGELLCGLLAKARKENTPESVTSVEVALPQPLLSSLFENTTLRDGADLKPVSNQGWEFDGTHPKSAGWKSATPGSAIAFEIEGEAIFLAFWRINGPMGKASVSVDGSAPILMDAWFDQTWGGYRNMISVGKDLKPGKHVVRVELLPERNPQSTGSEFRILCLGAAGQKNN